MVKRVKKGIINIQGKDREHEKNTQHKAEHQTSQLRLKVMKHKVKH